MDFVVLFLLAVGLAMDAFAVAICAGLTMKKAQWRKALIVGLYFGAFQAGMPLIGYLAAMRFAGGVFIGYSHWITFALLGLIGGKMMFESFKKEEVDAENEASLSPGHMVPLALATSIDALAVGVTFAFLDEGIVPAVTFIGIITFMMSTAGVKIGNVFGVRFKSKAEFFGGLILVVLGLRMLLSHNPLT